jgi:hypothetical protein
MSNFVTKIEKFAVYIIILYMATMTGLYFHMDSRISVLQTIQDKTLEKFSEKEKYHSEVDTKLTDEMNKLNCKVNSLSTELNARFNSITDILLNNISTNNIKQTPSQKTR